MAGNRAINYQDLKQLVEMEGPEACERHLVDALENRHIQPSDFSIREMAEAFVGREWVDSFRPKSGRTVRLVEADAVSFSHFSNITGQVFFNEVKTAYADEEFVFSAVVPTTPSRILDAEKVPGLSGIGDEFDVVGEREEYPMVGFSEDYVEVAAKRKRGGIVAVTKEAILADLTGNLLSNARKIGFWLGLNREKRIIDAIIDENGGATSIVNGGHRYHWRGTTAATYQTSAAAFPFYDNVTTSAGLVDWTDIDEAWRTLAAITDPYTGEPILIQPTHLIVTTQNLWTAARIVNATEVRNTTPGYATTGNPNQTDTRNPVQMVLGNLQVLSSRLLTARAATDTDWWLGNPQKAFRYFSIWDITPEESAQNSQDAFRRDIQMSFKISEMGCAATIEPRLMNESRA
jgi:hypothetical protein